MSSVRLDVHVLRRAAHKNAGDAAKTRSSGRRRRGARIVLVSVLWAAVPASAYAQAPPGALRPEALEKFVAYRAGLLTGQLEIAETDYAGWTGDQPGRTRYKTIRFAGDRSVIIDRGDEEGIVLRTTEGTPVTNLDAGTSPYFQFEAPGEVWNRSENPLSLVRVYGRAPELCADIRTLGAAPCPRASTSTT